MELMFEIISRQKFSANFPTSHVFSEAGGFIGRSDECEWILPDRGRRISRKHAIISCDGHAFYIEDVSRNGIFTQPGTMPLERGAQHKIEHGNSYTIGIYSFQARLLHRPDAYIEPRAGENFLLPADNMLSSDPLVALEQQENFEVKRRLGYYDDLLGETMQRQGDSPADHNSVATDSLCHVNMIPESELIEMPEDWDDDTDSALSAAVPAASPATPTASFAAPATPLAASATSPAVEQGSPTQDRVPVPETDVFFRMLGFAQIPDSPQERERMLGQAAEIILAAVDGLHHCLRNQAECKADLRLPVTTMRLSDNNPLNFTPTSKVALEHLLGPVREGMLPAGKAMLFGFNALHGHHLGLVAGARASIRAVLEKISPKSVEARLECNSPVYFWRKARLWHLFQKMHQALLDDHEGFAALFLHDFARAYDMQVRTLNPLTERSVFKGDS